MSEEKCLVPESTRQLKRVGWSEFRRDFKSLPKAPDNLSKHSDLSGLIFGKLLVCEQVDANFFGVKWSCRCLSGGRRDVWSNKLLRGIVTDCGCRLKWKKAKRRLKARKLRVEQRALKLEQGRLEKQTRPERYAAMQKRDADRRQQCREAAMKRWADHRANCVNSDTRKAA